MNEPGYIYVTDWDRFQHYGDRRPVWIKNYLDLLDNDEYLELDARSRALLEGIWKWTGTVGNGRVPASERSLRARLRLRYCDLQPLSDAGFLEVRASKALAPDWAKPHTRARAKKEEVREEKEIEKTPTSVGVAAPIETLAVVKAEPRERNEQWDGLAAVFGYTAAGDEARLWGKLCRSLKAKGATTATIIDAARRYRQSMPDVEMTPTALDKHYQRLLAAPDTTKARPGTAEHTLMLARQAAERERISA